jgi:hypothetical protein
MASGSTITADGLTTMTQVVAGTDLVETPDFNNARTNLNNLLGAPFDITLGTFDPTFTYGYNQGGAGVGAASTGANILATGANGAFKDLQDDIQAVCAFLGVSLRTGVGTDVTTSTTITAATWNNLMLNIQDCWNARFSPASTTRTQGVTSRVTAWTNTLTQITTWTWSTEEDCRAFFNGGGSLGMLLSRTGGSTNDQNTSWTNAMNAIGDVDLRHDTTTASAGTLSGIGFYELSTSYQTLLTYTSPTSPYTNDTIVISALVNSTTNPTSVSIRTELTDADDNNVDESVDGTTGFSYFSKRPDPSGSGFTFASPSVSSGAITGS